MKDKLSKVLENLEKKEKEMVGYLSELIEIPTINPPGLNYEKIVRSIEKRTKGLGLVTTKIITPEKILRHFNIKGGSERINLLANWNVGSKKTLHINSHYDVVGVSKNWRSDPFKATVKDRKLIGRGSEDMKANISCLLYAIEALKFCGIKPKANLQLSLTPDEETGGKTGLGYLVKNNLVRSDWAIGEGYSYDSVSFGNKGILWLKVRLKGKSSHASLPHKGINSFEKMNKVVKELERLKMRVSRRRTRFAMKDPLSRSATLVMGGLLEGGRNVNIVPGETSFSIDRRILPEENLKDARIELLDAIDKAKRSDKQIRFDLEFLAGEEPALSNRDETFFNIFEQAIKDIIGKRPKFFIMPGGTDLRYFIWKGVSSLGYSVRGGESWHSDNEFVYIDSLVETAKVFAFVIANLC